MTVEVDIPANTTAAVQLPGQSDGVIEVVSGRHRWSYPYQVPEPVHPVLMLDSTLGALFDHPTAYPEVMKVFAQHNPEFADRMNGQTQVTLREAVVQNPNPERLQAQVEAVLATLVSARES